MDSQPFGIALTGHRPSRLAGYDISAAYYQRLQAYLELVISQGLDQHGQLVLHCGMALGADTIWSQAILAQRELHPERITFVAHVPCLTQASRWPVPADRARWQHHLALADQRVIYAQEYSAAAMHQRNHAMIDASQLVLAVHDGGQRGGTAQAVSYARSKGVRVYTIDPQRFQD